MKIIELALSILIFFPIQGSYAQSELFKSDTKLTMVMVNVDDRAQQGDAIVISEPSGRTVLIDTGAPEEARDYLIPFLKNNKLFDLDTIFITHPHSDHYGGLPLLQEDENFKIGTIYFGPVSDALCKREKWGCSLDDLSQIRDLAKKRDTPILEYNKFRTISFKNGAKLEKLFQFDESNTPISDTDINDLSFIARLVFENSTVLLTGDLNEPLSNWIVAKHPEMIKSSILKVPHHGADSAASNDFIKLTNAKYFLVPGPVRTWCSDRSKRIRELSEKLGVKVFVNGLHGNLYVRFGSGKVEVDSERDPGFGCP